VAAFKWCSASARGGQQLLLLPGTLVIQACTHTALNNGVLQQGSSLTIVQQEMVLDNLELFRQQRQALPWHIKFTSGSVTINDTISPSYTQSWSPVSQMLALAPSRSIQLQWNIVPVLRGEDLTSLAGIYKSDTLDGPSDKVDPTLIPTTCQKDGNVYFAATFQEGSSRPSKRPYGFFNGKYIWVKDTDEARDCFNQIFKAVLAAAPIHTEDLGLTPASAQKGIGR
jgi:hypothetical protein